MTYDVASPNRFRQGHGYRALSALAVVLLIAAVPSYGWGFNDVAGDLILFNDNGAWSWFEDERAIVDTLAQKLLVSSVAHGSGAGGAARNGDVDVAALDLTTGTVTRFVLADGLQADDHNSAALWRRPDGRYVASYSRHGSDQLTRYRVTTAAGDISAWGAEQSVDNDAGATYSNLHYLPADNSGAGRLYNFVRSVNFDPNVLVSNNLGTTFSYAGKLLTEGGSGDRPYLRYFSNGEQIHFIATERHPRNFDNSIYHGYVQDGQLFNSTSDLRDSNLFDDMGIAPASLTPIFTTGTEFGGTTMRRAWTIDVAIDEVGLPYALFQARANDEDDNHRFFYARFTGTEWDVYELAKAGGFLYGAENDYTGLGALDPSNPNRVFISTKIDPRSDVSLSHYELFEGITDDGGATWNWSPITYNSTVDNLRPIVPRWDDDNTAVLWLRGAYSTYTNYNLNVVGLTEIEELAESVLGDLNRDGTFDLDDFGQFMTYLHSNLSGLSLQETYERGDLNGDFTNNYEDFVIFRDTWLAVHGEEGFARLFRQVPESSSVNLAIGSVSTLLLSSHRVSRGI